MTLLLRICTYMLMLNALIANAQNWEWIGTIGDTGKDMGTAVINDADGNVYITGSFNGNIQFDRNNQNAKKYAAYGKEDIFLAKYTVEGALLWAVQAGSSANDAAKDVAVDAEGNVWITGFFEKQASFGEEGLILEAKGSSRDAFIAKYDPSGNLLMARQIGGVGISTGHKISTNKDNGVVFIGDFSGQLGLGQISLNAKSENDGFVAQCSKKGVIEWMRTISSDVQTNLASVTMDLSGDILLTGAIEGTTDFEELLMVSRGKQDAFVAKYANDGSLMWVKQLGGQNNIFGTSICSDMVGNILLTACYEGAFKWGKFDLISKGNNDILVAKFSKEGRLLQVSSIGGHGNDKSTVIAADQLGNYWLTGNFEERMSFEQADGTMFTQLEVTGGTDIFVVKYNAEGSLQGVRSVGGTFADEALGMSVDERNNVWLVANFENSISFDDWTVQGKETDVALAKFSEKAVKPYIEPNFIYSEPFVNIHTHFQDKSKGVPNIKKWLWDFGDGTTSTEPSPTHTYDSFGTYEVSLTVENARTTEEITQTIVIEKPEAVKGNWLWTKGEGGTSKEVVESIVTDSYNNIWLTGNFEDSILITQRKREDTVEHVLKSKGLNDIFLAKYSEFGETLWSRRVGGEGSENALSIAADTANNTYMTGWFENMSIIGNFALENKGESDIFVAKFHEKGHCLWAREAGGEGIDEGAKIVSDKAGNLAVAGTFEELASWGQKALIAKEGKDVFVAKYNTDGELLWVKQLGGEGFDLIGDISFDNVGNVLVTGTFEKNIKIGDTILESVGYDDIFIAKYNSEGELMWAKQGGGSLFDSGTAIISDDMGRVWVSGHFWGNAYFGEEASLTALDKKDVFLLCYNPDGTLVWTKQGKGTGRVDIHMMAKDNYGNILLTGSFEEQLNFDYIDLETTDDKALFMAAFAKNGRLLWANKLKDNNSETPNIIHVGKNGDLFFSGTFKGNFLLGEEALESEGSSDWFVGKYKIE